MADAAARPRGRLPPEVNRCVESWPGFGGRGGDVAANTYVCVFLTPPPSPPLSLPPSSSILYVRNLPFNATGDEIYALFGKYGAIRQVRLGTAKDAKGSAYVVFEDIYDAKAAADHLSGFNVGGRYLIVLYFNPAKRAKQVKRERERERSWCVGCVGGRKVERWRTLTLTTPLFQTIRSRWPPRRRSCASYRSSTGWTGSRGGGGERWAGGRERGGGRGGRGEHCHENQKGAPRSARPRPFAPHRG